jgi:hypothetical protein
MEPTTEVVIFVLGHLTFFIYQSEVCFAGSLCHVSEPSHWRWIHSCDRKVTARRAECQRSSINGFAEAKALIASARSSHHLTLDWGIWSHTR